MFTYMHLCYNFCFYLVADCELSPDYRLCTSYLVHRISQLELCAIVGDYRYIMEPLPIDARNLARQVDNLAPIIHAIYTW